MTTLQNIHGHEVLHLLLDAATPYTRATLTVELERRFGPTARFCTCSTTDMTLEDLLDFLTARGKIVEQGGQLRADVSQMCSSGPDHQH